MSTEDAPKSVKMSQEDFDAVQNRIQLALAKHENIVKSWTSLSSRKEPSKTDEQLDAEDAALFRNEPPYLGIGAAIPAQYLVSDAERNNKSLRAKFFPTKGLKGSKSRESEEKSASAKRALDAESSDEEGGRSSLGKAKKVKTSQPQSVSTEEPLDKIKVKQNTNRKKSEGLQADNPTVSEASNVENNGSSGLETPPITPEKDPCNRTLTNSIEVKEQKEEVVKTQRSLSEEMRRQLKLHKRSKKKLYRQRKRDSAIDNKLARSIAVVS